MDVGGYRYNNKGFCEKFTFSKSINRGRTTIIEVHDSIIWNEILLENFFIGLKISGKNIRADKLSQ